MQNPRVSRLAAVASAIVVAVAVFFCGVAAGRSSAPEVDAEAPAAAPTTVAPPAQESIPRVIVYGDSLATQAEPYIALLAQALGLEVEVRALGGTAPCDFVDRLDEDIAGKKLDLAVWAFSGNSIGGCMSGGDGAPLSGQALFDRYHDDTERAIEAAEHAKLSFVLASPPAPHLPGDVWQQLDSVYRWLAGAHPSVQYTDAGVAISPDGQFVDTQRCLPWEQRIPQAKAECAADGTITVRGADGHFCPVSATTGLECTTYSSGAMRYAINLMQAARLELDYQAQVAAGKIPPP